MKTITEYSGFVLKEAVAKKASLLSEGKTEEEAQAAIHEQLKLDEAKVIFYKNALDMTSSRLDRVKRVVVALRATEDEKVPEAFIEREGHFYLVEYFPQNDGRSRVHGNHRDADSRGSGNAHSRKGGGRENHRERSSFAPPMVGREPVAPKTSQPAPGGGLFAKNTGAPSVHQPVRTAKPARAPREKRGPAVQKGPQGAGELRLVFKGQSNATTLPGSGIVEATASLVTPVVE